MERHLVLSLAHQSGLEDWTGDGNWRGVDDDLLRFAENILAHDFALADAIYALEWHHDNPNKDSPTDEPRKRDARAILALKRLKVSREAATAKEST